MECKINTKEDIMATGFFQDDNGNNSMMRLMSFFMMLATIGSGLVTLLASSADKTAGIYITGLFAIAAFCPKAMQKFMEVKGVKP